MPWASIPASPHLLPRPPIPGRNNRLNGLTSPSTSATPLPRAARARHPTPAGQRRPATVDLYGRPRPVQMSAIGHPCVAWMTPTTSKTSPRPPHLGTILPPHLPPPAPATLRPPWRPPQCRTGASFVLARSSTDRARHPPACPKSSAPLPLPQKAMPKPAMPPWPRPLPQPPSPRM